MSEFREKFSLLQGKPMHAVVEAKSMFRFVPRGPDEPKGRWLEKAARVFGLTPSQAKKIEYEEVKDMRASRLDAMREKLNELQQGAAKRRELSNGITQRFAELRSDQGSRDVDRDRHGAGPASGGSLGEGEGGRRAGRPQASPRTDEGR